MTGKQLKALKQRVLTLSKFGICGDDKKKILRAFEEIVKILSPETEAVTEETCSAAIDAVGDNVTIPESARPFMEEVASLCDRNSSVRITFHP